MTTIKHLTYSLTNLQKNKTLARTKITKEQTMAKKRTKKKDQDTKTAANDRLYSLSCLIKLAKKPAWRDEHECKEWKNGVIKSCEELLIELKTKEADKARQECKSLIAGYTGEELAQCGIV